MKRSCEPLPSCATRLVARLAKSSFVPSGEKAPPELSPLPSVPSAATETRVTAAVVRSLMKTSPTPLPSPSTRLSPRLEKAKVAPSGEKEEAPLEPLAPSPAALLEISDTVPVAISLRNTPYPVKSTPGRRFFAVLKKATCVPSGENRAPLLVPSPATPCASDEMSMSSPVSRSLKATASSAMYVLPGG